MTSLRPGPLRRRLATAARVIGSAGILAVGMLAAPVQDQRRTIEQPWKIARAA